MDSHLKPNLSRLSRPISLSVVCSFRNEEAVLPEFIRRVRKVLQAEIDKEILSSYELIFVDDASTDQSWKVLVDLAKGENDIRIIRMSRCFGPSPSPCVLAGMQYASGEAVIYMDCDLQDPPELIPQLLEVFRNDDTIDVVHTLRQSRKGEPPLKLWVTRIGYLILNKVTSINLPIEAGDFKLLSRRVVNYLVRFQEKKPFLRGLVCWVGFKQAFVPYHREARFVGETKFNIFGRDVIGNFFDSALISFSSVPLRISIFLGFVSILIVFVMLIHVLSEKLQGKAIPGWTAIMISMLFIGSVQFLCTGILGLYINSIFEETKRRPNFIIDETFGFSKVAPNKNLNKSVEFNNLST